MRPARAVRGRQLMRQAAMQTLYTAAADQQRDRQVKTSGIEF